MIILDKLFCNGRAVFEADRHQIHAGFQMTHIDFLCTAKTRDLTAHTVRQHNFADSTLCIDIDHVFSRIWVDLNCLDRTVAYTMVPCTLSV